MNLMQLLSSLQPCCAGWCDVAAACQACSDLTGPKVMLFSSRHIPDDSITLSPFCSCSQGQPRHMPPVTKPWHVHAFTPLSICNMRR